MKHEKNSKELEKLIKAFESAERRVNSVFQTSKTESQLKINIDKQANINEFSLVQSAKDWAETDLPNSFQKGYNSVDISPQMPQTTFFDLSQSVLPFVEISGKVHASMQEFTSAINEKLSGLQKQGYVTVEAVKNSVVDAVGGSVPTIKYQNGANVPISKYAEMLARTSRIETANGGIIARCKDINHDLVKYLALPSCCPRCQRFNNKVFSVSGMDKRFPYLYGENGPFKGGYNITHPNCRCEILPFVEEMHQDEMEKIIKESNHFTNYSKSDKMFDEYNRQQAYNRQRNAELVEYFKLKDQLGKDFPYKRLGDFRKAKHSNSQAYKDVKQRANQNKYNCGFFEHIDLDIQLNDKLIEYQSFVQDKEVEYAFVILCNGDVHRFKGDKYSVNSNENLDMEQAINIHNHPPESDNGFSRDDFEYMQRHQQATYLLFTKSYTYSCEILKDISKLNYNLIKKEARNVPVPEMELEEEHLVFNYLKKEGYIDYDRFKP